MPHITRPIKITQYLFRLVIGNQRSRLLIVDFQARFNGLSFIIITLDQRTPASITLFTDLGRGEIYVKDTLAFLTTAPSTQSCDNILPGHTKVYDSIERVSVYAQNAAQFFCLRNSSRKSIQDKSISAEGLSEFRAHHINDHGVRYKPALVHVFFGFEP